NGCDPIPVTRPMFTALQRSDPRCKDAPELTDEDKQALSDLAEVVKTLTQKQQQKSCTVQIRCSRGHATASGKLAWSEIIRDARTPSTETAGAKMHQPHFLAVKQNEDQINNWRRERCCIGRASTGPLPYRWVGKCRQRLAAPLLDPSLLRMRLASRHCASRWLAARWSEAVWTHNS